MRRATDKFVRFSDYDIFAYLAAGLAVLALADRVVGTAYVIGAHWDVASGAMTLAAASVIGHLAAGPAAVLLDRWLVEKWLGAPSRHLFGAGPPPPRCAACRWLLGDYFRPLQQGVIDRVLARAAAERRPDQAGEDVFWTAFPVAKRDDTAYPRMEAFLKLSGFCRNLGFVALAGTPLLLAGAGWRWARGGWSEAVWQDGLVALLVLLAGSGMVLRYLKFYRLYAMEVFIAYSETAEKK